MRIIVELGTYDGAQRWLEVSAKRQIQKVAWPKSGLSADLSFAKPEKSVLLWVTKDAPVPEQGGAAQRMAWRTIATAVVSVGKEGRISVGFLDTTDEYRKSFEGYVTVVNPGLPGGNAPVDAIARASREIEARYASYKKGKFLNKVCKTMILKSFTSNDGMLPPWAFMQIGCDDEPPDERFVESLLEYASYLHGQSPDWVIQSATKWSDLSPSDKRTLFDVIGAMITAAGTTVYYDTDRTGYGEEGERFQMSYFTRLLLGDCEDVGADTAHMGDLIKAVQANRLRPIIDLLNLYEFALCTGAATSPSLQSPTASDTNEPDDYICHVFCMAIPKNARMLGGSGTLLPVLYLEATNFTVAQHTPLAPSQISEANAKWRAHALRQDLDAFRHMTYVLPAMSTFDASRPALVSRFMRYVNSVAFVEREGSPEFSTQTATPDGLVMGATFLDFISDNLPPLKGLPRELPHDMVQRLLESEPVCIKPSAVPELSPVGQGSTHGDIITYVLQGVPSDKTLSTLADAVGKKQNGITVNGYEIRRFMIGYADAKLSVVRVYTSGEPRPQTLELIKNLLP